jgi:hypothetical protein
VRRRNQTGLRHHDPSIAPAKADLFASENISELFLFLMAVGHSATFDIESISLLQIRCRPELAACLANKNFLDYIIVLYYLAKGDW